MHTPYPFQEDAIESIPRYYINGGTGHPVVAMPTATGKSLVQAEFCKRTLYRWPNQRIIALTHVKELIEQNAESILEQWPGAPIGIFSAGLRQRDIEHPIIYGGVGSVVNAIQRFGHRDLMLIDEAHLLSPKEGTNYQEVIKGLSAMNPYLKVVGFTATPYRTGQGLLTEGNDRIFTDICYDITGFGAFNKLIADGYLVMPVPKRTKTEFDLTGVKIIAHEYQKDQLEKAVDKDHVTYAACQEMIEEGWDRQHWLIFASGVKHADHIAKVLQGMGIEAESTHSKMPDSDATERIKAFKNSELRAIVNYGKLTTGFNFPPIDLIGDLRPTMSTGLHVQKIGRGMRPSIPTHKENCLVLDFARNTLRLGCVNDPIIPKRRVKGDVPGVPPIKICEYCGVYNHARCTHCFNCGAEFPIKQKLVATAGTEELIRHDEKEIIGDFAVSKVIYARYQKKGRPDMIKVMYICGVALFVEYVCLEHTGKMLLDARKWWREHMGVMVPPPSTAEALKYISSLKVPKRIRVQTNCKYPKVVACQYD